MDMKCNYSYNHKKKNSYIRVGEWPAVKCLPIRVSTFFIREKDYETHNSMAEQVH